MLWRSLGDLHLYEKPATNPEDHVRTSRRKNSLLEMERDANLLQATHDAIIIWIRTSFKFLYHLINKLLAFNAQTEALGWNAPFCANIC